MISHAYRVGACTVREAFLKSGVTGVTSVTGSFGNGPCGHLTAFLPPVRLAGSARQFFLYIFMLQRYEKKMAFTPYVQVVRRGYGFM